MCVNTYGIKMTGLDKASRATADWPVGSGGCTQISYDMVSGEVLVNDHVGDEWTQYNDEDIITVCYTNRHMSEQRIANEIKAVLTMLAKVREMK